MLKKPNTFVKTDLEIGDLTSPCQITQRNITNFPNI